MPRRRRGEALEKRFVTTTGRERAGGSVMRIATECAKIPRQIRGSPRRRFFPRGGLTRVRRSNAAGPNRGEIKFADHPGVIPTAINQSSEYLIAPGPRTFLDTDTARAA